MKTSPTCLSPFFLSEQYIFFFSYYQAILFDQLPELRFDKWGLILWSFSSCFIIHVCCSEHDIHLPKIHILLSSTSKYFLVTPLYFLHYFTQLLTAWQNALFCLHVIPNSKLKNSFWQAKNCQLVSNSPTLVLPKLHQPIIKSGQHHLFWANWI
jgi:hypothetical protein